MSDRVRIDELAKTVMDGLEEYANLATEDLKKAVKKAGQECKKNVQEKAPVKTGKDKKSWAVKTIKETSNSMKVTVHSTNQYQLTHLLEFGHYHLDPDDGLTLNLGVNPLLQFGLKETREQLCMNILYDLSVVDYVPFDSNTIGNPALDLGDVIKFRGGQADGTKISAITSMQCKIGGKHTLKGVGKNPRLAQAKSKNDKNISGLLNQIIDNKEAGKIGIHTFTNASSFNVGESDVKIISIEFAASEEVMAQFFGSVILSVKADQIEKSVTAAADVVIPSVKVTGVEPEVGDSGDLSDEADVVEGDAVDEPEVIGNTEEQTVSVELPVTWREDGQALVHFTFEFNDSIIEIHQPEEHWHSGRHSIVLYYPIEGLIANYRNIFNVYMRVEGGSATVNVGDCLAGIMGQSMGAGEAWDGEIKIEEYIKRVNIGGAIKMQDIWDYRFLRSLRRYWSSCMREVRMFPMRKRMVNKFETKR